MYTIYCGIDILCGNCGATTRCSMHIMWKNQHGVKIRVFCRHCGAMTDTTNIYRLEHLSDPVVHPMRTDIHKLPWQPGYRPLFDRTLYATFVYRPYRVRAPYTYKCVNPPICRRFYNCFSRSTSDGWGVSIVHPKYAELPF